MTGDAPVPNPYSEDAFAPHPSPRGFFTTVVNVLSGGGPGPSQRFYDLQEERAALELEQLKRSMGVDPVEGRDFASLVRDRGAFVIVGETGSGKSVTARALCKLYEKRGREVCVWKAWDVDPITGDIKDPQHWRVVNGFKEAPKGAVLLLHEAAYLHAERGEAKPSEAFTTFLARSRHNGNILVVLGQSANQMPKDVFATKVGQFVGFKPSTDRPGIIDQMISGFTREEAQQYEQRAASILRQMPPAKGLTCWIGDKVFTTLNGDA